MEDLDFQVYHRDDLIANVKVRGMSVTVKNHSNNIIFRPFTTERPTYLEFLEFMEDRCVPKTRADISQLLASIGLTEYNPIEIVKRSHGVMFEDFIWIKFKGEKLTYEDVKIRD